MMMRFRLTDSPGGGKSKMNSVVFSSSLILGLVFMILPYKTSSAPTTAVATNSSNNTGTYITELLTYVQANKCPFPILEEIQNGTEVFKSISKVCNTSFKAFEGETKVTKNNTFVCVAVADFISRICTKAKKAPEILTSSKISMSITTDLKSTATVSQFCNELRLIKLKTEDFEPTLFRRYNEFISDKLQEARGTGSESAQQTCEVACAAGGVSDGTNADFEASVNPGCLLLKKELEIMDALKSPSAENESNKNREGVSDFKPQESQNSGAANIPDSASLSVPDGGDEVSKDNVSTKNKHTSMNGSSIKPDKHNISPIPNIADDMQGDEPKLENPNSAIQKSDKKDEKLDPSNDRVVSMVSPPEVSKSSSTTTTTSTVSSADKNRINSEELETPPAAEKPKPSESSNNGDKQSAQEQKPPTDVEKSKSSASNDKVSSSPTPETVSSSNKDGAAILPQQKPSKAKDEDDNFNMNGENYDAIGPAGEVDDGEDNVNLNSLQDEKLKGNAGTSGKKSDSSPNKFTDEGDGRIPLESPNSPSSSFDDVDGSGGYFNYFIFFLTVMALCFFAFHNKRRILAFVVEGRRPRGAGGRTRRRSSGSSGASYRRLENNFE